MTESNGQAGSFRAWRSDSIFSSVPRVALFIQLAWYGNGSVRCVFILQLEDNNNGAWPLG